VGKGTLKFRSLTIERLVLGLNKDLFLINFVFVSEMPTFWDIYSFDTTSRLVIIGMVWISLIFSTSILIDSGFYIYLVSLFSWFIIVCALDRTKTSFDIFKIYRLFFLLNLYFEIFSSWVSTFFVMELGMGFNRLLNFICKCKGENERWAEFPVTSNIYSYFLITRVRVSSYDGWVAFLLTTSIIFMHNPILLQLFSFVSSRSKAVTELQILISSSLN